MATVYKHWKRSLESVVPLLIAILLILFQLIALTSSTLKGYTSRMEYAGKEKYLDGVNLSHIHKLVKRRPVDEAMKQLLPKRNVNKTIPLIKAQTRSTAKLHCNISEVKHDENVTLKWTKLGNSLEHEVLTQLEQVYVENTTESECSGDDKRFLAKVNDNDWCLHIRYTMNSDAGMYQCQICHGFASSKCSTSKVSLKLIDARANIIGGPRKFIPNDKELPLRLSCVLINSIEPPSYIFWYHEDRMINYDLEDGATVREGPQGSELIFPKANKTHVGNYSCVPSNAQLDSVMVYYGGRNRLIRE